MDEDICLQCEASLPDMVEECPQCGASIDYCTNPACGRALTSGIEFCPFCGERNLAFQSPDTSDPMNCAPNAPREAVGEYDKQDDAPDASSAGSQPDPTALAKDIATALGEFAPQGENPREALAPNHPAAADGEGKEAAHSSPAIPSTEGASKVPSKLEPIGRNPLVDSDSGADSVGAEFFGTGVATQGVTSPGQSLCPFSLEYDGGQAYRIDCRGLIRLRIRTSSVPEGGTLRVQLESSADTRLCMSDPGGIVLQALGSLETRELPPVRCTPSVAGSDAVSVTLDLFDANGVPHSRWRGTITISVQGHEEREINIHAGGDIVDLGGGSGGFGDLLSGLSTNGGEATPSTERWLPVTLYLDQSFAARVSSLQPAGALAAPVEGPPMGDEDTVSARWIELKNDFSGENSVYIHAGSEIKLGRGTPGANPIIHAGIFHLDADNGEEVDTRRISGTHLHLRIRWNYAWVRDASSNGTWLNGERIPKGEWTVIADGDRLSLRKVANFVVRLQTGEDGVAAVRLTRERAGSHVQSVVLTLGLFALPERGPSPIVADEDSEDDSIWIATTHNESNGTHWHLWKDGWVPIGAHGNAVSSWHARPGDA